MIEQFCPECGEDNYVTTKYPGLLQCCSCGEVFDDESEELEYRKSKFKKKQRYEDDDE